MKIITKFLWVFIIVFGILGVATFFIFVFITFIQIPLFQDNPEFTSNFENLSLDLIGTVFAIAGIASLLLTLLSQNVENQKKQTENNFFRMIDYHTENVKQMDVSDINPNKVERSAGRRAFVIFQKQIKEIQKSLEGFIQPNKIILSDLEKMDIIFICFYYGIEDKSQDLYNRFFYNIEEGEAIALAMCQIMRSHSLKIGRTNQTSLNSYFRNLYSAIKLIDRDRYLSEKEKKEYIEILRAQLSNPELLVLFLYVVSRFGKKWEDNNYITKYELIKYLPLHYMEWINPKVFFPDIKFEEDETNGLLV